MDCSYTVLVLDSGFSILVIFWHRRFVILEEFFNGLDIAIRLLKLKGSLTTFANIRPKIEYLANR